MAHIDKLLEKMAAGHAESAYLHGDEPVIIAFRERKSSGAIIPAEQLHSILNEIIPHDLLSKLERHSKITFLYDSPHGRFDVDIYKSGKTLTAYIAPNENASFENSGPFDTDWEDFDSPPDSTKETQRTIQFQPGMKVSDIIKAAQSEPSNSGNRPDTITLDDGDLISGNVVLQRPEYDSSKEKPETSFGCSIAILAVAGFFLFAGISTVLQQGGISRKGDLAVLIFSAMGVCYGVSCLLKNLQTTDNE